VKTLVILWRRPGDDVLRETIFREGASIADYQRRGAADMALVSVSEMVSARLVDTDELDRAKAMRARITRAYTDHPQHDFRKDNNGTDS
jgi:hypothetical protein